ncbi:hypothetical protein Dvina_01355 [Dactylosporangium vinaceum]|uniref:N-acetyltransferase domain-containing protein n=1 Tax=Dactylosporangium vinaceum TaxID=53362 RepID=A0ABV5MLN3_9ACTN|nr:hypothetical protein [Dactylosporangium vinaceum]UAB96905.1 hypothetical protein Dvina_01355 [Dactylosporangium vinaceum]
MTAEWHPEPLSDDHEIGLFDCGVPALNLWLATQARRAQAADTARTYVWADDERDVVAYYSICPTQLMRNELPSRSVSGGFTVVPAYLLARLALDTRLRGRGHGGDLLVDALTTIVNASETGAGRVIVVDAIDGAAVGFYEHYGFIRVRDQDADHQRLVMTVATARRNLGIGSLRFTANAGIRLGSIVLRAPDGTEIPAVVTMTELEAVMSRINELAVSQNMQPDLQINLSEVFIEVLGRDPIGNIEPG